MLENRVGVVLVDDNVEFTAVVEEFLSRQPDIVVMGTAYNGKAAIELIEEVQPDVVVLDVIMPHLDGLGVIEYIQGAGFGRRPRIMVVSAIGLETTAASILAAGADYYLAKPFDLSTLAERIRRLAAIPPDTRPSEQPSARAHTTPFEFEASRALREIGIPANLRGYVYLRDAIILALGEGDMPTSITHVVYPTIARRHNTTASRVERSMRHAIETAWMRGDINTLNDVFGHTVDAEKGRPTNSAFIARIADKIRLDRTTAR
jgi:two-component system response regulator (stage 0 sporulation protein A)